ncbi:hypothetical protein BJX64DRAFT_293814 [Aspergillus heterothallicus]
MTIPTPPAPLQPVPTLQAQLLDLTMRQVTPAKPADALDTAIDTVSEGTLRSVFKSLCEICPETRRLAAEKLLVDTRQKREAPESDFNSDSEGGDDENLGDVEEDGTSEVDAPREGTSTTNTLKRPVSRYAACQNCEREFDVTTNTSTSCTYHPKSAEATGDELFEDNWDEFDTDTPELREELPHCFTFSCCDGNLRDNPEGCQTGWHQVRTESSNKKKRSALY